MENSEQNSNEERICKICLMLLSEDDHGNRKSHRDCAYRNKKKRQKVKYKIGNPAKLMIQKNETVAAQLYEMDQQKQGIPSLMAMELGFKFNCPATKRNHDNKIINMFDKYGYVLETIDNEILIFLYHESEL